MSEGFVTRRGANLVRSKPFLAVLWISVRGGLPWPVRTLAARAPKQAYFTQGANTYRPAETSGRGKLRPPKGGCAGNPQAGETGPRKGGRHRTRQRRQGRTRQQWEEQ